MQLSHLVSALGESVAIPGFWLWHMQQAAVTRAVNAKLHTMNARDMSLVMLGFSQMGFQPPLTKAKLWDVVRFGSNMFPLKGLILQQFPICFAIHNCPDATWLPRHHPHSASLHTPPPPR